MERLRLNGKLIVILAAAIAVFLLALFWPSGQKDARTDTERRLEEVLSHVQGAGRVRVFVYEETADAEFVFADFGDKSEILGVVIVAQGADNPQTVSNLARAAQAALGVEQNRIEIIPMQSEEGRALY